MSYYFDWLSQIKYDYNGFVNGTFSWDTLRGDGGNELLLGYSGNDLMYGGGGDDLMYGGGGSDFLAGNRGDDFMIGGNGKDILGGVFGNNIMEGGNGKDTFIFDTRQWKVEKGGEEFSSTIVDFEPKLDTIALYGVGRTAYNVEQDGDDVVIETFWGNEIAVVLDAYAEDVCDAIDETPDTWAGYQESVNPFEFA